MDDKYLSVPISEDTFGRGQVGTEPITKRLFESVPSMVVLISDSEAMYYTTEHGQVVGSGKQKGSRLIRLRKLKIMSNRSANSLAWRHLCLLHYLGLGDA